MVNVVHGRGATPLFSRGLSALTKLVIYIALSIVLMLTDARWHFTTALRSGIHSALTPFVEFASIPLHLGRNGAVYLQSLKQTQKQLTQAQIDLVTLAQTKAQLQQIQNENANLRQLLHLKALLPQDAQATQILYENQDPFSRRIVLDKGQSDGVIIGSAVMDELGLLGQVVRVSRDRSEVTLITQREQWIPVLNSRTQTKLLIKGTNLRQLELSTEVLFVPKGADIQKDDVLMTHGLDGIYPPNVPVAIVQSINPNANSDFLAVYAKPVSRLENARYAMILKPQKDAQTLLLELTRPQIPNYSINKKQPQSMLPAESAVPTQNKANPPSAVHLKGEQP